MYFFEFKLSIDNIIEKINDIKKVYYRFIESFENIKTTQGFNINYNFKNLILACNKNISDVKNKINQNKMKENIIYSNPQVGMSLIFRINNKIININNKIE